MKQINIKNLEKTKIVLRRNKIVLFCFASGLVSCNKNEFQSELDGNGKRTDFRKLDEQLKYKISFDDSSYIDTVCISKQEKLTFHSNGKLKTKLVQTTDDLGKSILRKYDYSVEGNCLLFTHFVNDKKKWGMSFYDNTGVVYVMYTYDNMERKQIHYAFDNNGALIPLAELGIP